MQVELLQVLVHQVAQVLVLTQEQLQELLQVQLQLAQPPQPQISTATGTIVMELLTEVPGAMKTKINAVNAEEQFVINHPHRPAHLLQQQLVPHFTAIIMAAMELPWVVTGVI